jgi:hypothetical protein
MQQTRANLKAQYPIIGVLSSIFLEVLEFDEHALPALVNLLERQPKDLRIDPNHILVQNGINKLRFGNQKAQKRLLENLRMILCCAHVLLHEKKQSQLHEVSQEEYLAFFDKCLLDPRFVAGYNDNNPNDRRDVPFLLNYYKYLKLAIELLPPVRNKGLAIQIAGRLDGSGQVYILGSGQKDSATRREAIYHLLMSERPDHSTSTIPVNNENSYYLDIPMSDATASVASQEVVVKRIEPQPIKALVRSAAEPESIQTNMVTSLLYCEELLKRIKRSKRKHCQVSHKTSEVKSGEELIQCVWEVADAAPPVVLKRSNLQCSNEDSEQCFPSSPDNCDSIGASSVDDSINY